MPRRRFAPGQTPGGLAEIDWTHPLARGLARAWVPGSQSRYTDLCGHGLFNLAAAETLLATQDGAAQRVNGSGTSNYVTVPNPSDLNSGSLTLFIRALDIVLLGTGGFYSDLLSISTATSEIVGEIGFTTGSVPGLSIYRISGSGYPNVDGTAGTLPAGGNYALTFDSVAGVAKAYQNSTVVVNAATSGNETLTGLYIADRGSTLGNGTRSVRATIPCFYAYNRPLSDSEIAQLNADPYQILRPVQVRRRAAAATASGIATGTATGTFTATATGARIAAAAGTATGTFTTTAVGRRNAAAASTATGTFTTTAVGRSTAAAAGTATATFAASAVGTTMATGQATGTATGTFAATGVGLSQATAAGTTAIVGTATGIGVALASTAGSAAIVFAASASGAANAPAAGTATATFMATAAAAINAAAATGTATGTFTATASGRRLRHGAMPMFTIIS